MENKKGGKIVEDYNYDQDLFIDIDQLEVEWLTQPHRYRKYAELCSDAESEKQEAKQFLDLKKAELDGVIRNNLKEQEVKITEAQVAAQVLQHNDYLEAEDNYNKKCHNYNILKVAVESFHQRKTALENLVKLALAEWFSAPIEPRSIQEIGQKAHEDIDNLMIKNLNSKKRRKVNGKKK